MKNRRSAYHLEKLEPRLLFSADLALLPIDGGALAVDQDVLLTAPSQLGSESDQIAETVEQVHREVIFIDAGVEDYQQLIDDIETQVAEGLQLGTILLDSNTDGIAQISDYLNSHQDISAVHIISHGSDGEVVLGNAALNLSTLDGYAEAIESWQYSLTDQADLLFYGCNLASGEEGQGLISSLALLTGADVAASDDATGQATLGGDWELEHQTGKIETTSLVIKSLSNWDGLLATFTVNTTTDTVDVNPGDGVAIDASGNTSLRTAIMEANALAGVDTILLGTDTYTLTISGVGEDAGDLNISDSVEIIGNGAQNTIIDGNHIDRIFDFLFGSAGSSITGVTIANGDPGASGGAIYSNTAISISDSSIVDSSASSGGAIFANDTLTLNNVTISGNSANVGGGIVLNAGDGHSLTNVTISGNTAMTSDSGGLRIRNSASTTLTNVTIANNSAFTDGGGVYNDNSTVNMINTIIANNTAGGTGNDVFGTYLSNGTNIVEDVSGSVGFGSDITGIDPLLGLLQDNGGTTLTHELLSGSPAIDTADRTMMPTTDQRGFLRSDGLPDIGAYEAGTSAAATADYLDQFNAIAYDGDDGVLPWSNDWQEIGEADGPTYSGPGVSVYNRGGWGQGLYLFNDSVGVWREVDLSGADTATLSFDWAAAGMGGTSVTLEISTDGGTNWDVIATYVADSAPQSVSYDISAYIDSDTRIKFETTTLTGEFFVDNVLIDISTGSNAAPTADATNGEPYTINEGDSLTLDGSASSDPDGDTLTYAWDLDNDGSYDDATGATPTVDWATLQPLGVDDDGSYTIGLEVNDGRGGIATTSTTLTVNNTAPTLSVTGATTVVDGATYTLNLSTTDPGNDTITSWTINWGDGSIETIAGNPPTATHTYANAGFTNNILVSATDEDNTANYIHSDLFAGRYVDDAGIYRIQGTWGNAPDEFGIDVNLDKGIQPIVGPDGNLYISGESSRNVLQYNATSGASMGIFATTAGNAGGIAFGPDGNLYVADYTNREILQFNGGDGSSVGAFVTGIGGDPYGIIFGPDGNLYVNTYNTAEVYKYDGTTGVSLGIFINSGAGGLGTPEQMVFGPDGNLYIADVANNSVLLFDGSDGTYLGDFIPATEPNLDKPNGLAFGPDGNLYVTDSQDGLVLRFDGSTGAFIDEYVSGLDKPSFLAFAPDHQVLIQSGNTAPVATADSFTVNEGSSANNLDLAINDTDADGNLDLNSITIISGPTNGNIDSINGDGTVDYTHDGSETLTDSFTYTIDDLAGATSNTVTVSLTITPVNDAPVLGAIGNQSVNELTTLNFSASATDSDLPADTLAYSLDATSLTAGMTINSGTGAFSWTPAEAQSGVHSVTIAVTDDGTGLLTDSETFTITVNEINVAPVLTPIGNQTVDELSTLSFNATATDADLPVNNLSYSLDATSLAAGMTIDSITGAFSWTPTEAQDGVHSVTVMVTDDGTGTLSDSETFSITVNEINVAPVLTPIGNQTVDELATLIFTATATDADLPGHNLTYSLDAASILAGMTIDGVSGSFSWTPTEAQDGLYSVTVTVTDDGTGTLSASETFSVTVNEINVNPVLNPIGNQNVDELSTLNFTASAMDADQPANNLSYTLDGVSLGLGMTIDSGTGAFSWTPSEAQDGAHSVTITVTDDGTGLLSDSETFTITVNEINAAPTAVADSYTVNEGSTTTLDLASNDSDPDDGLDLTSITIVAGPANGAIVVNNDGTVDYTHDGSETVADSFTYTIDDASAATSNTVTVSLTITPVNDAPILGAIGNQSVNELTALTFTASATDSDLPADTLTYSLDATSLAAGMTIDANSGAFSWTPTEVQDGLHSVTITVTDDGTGLLSDSETFTIIVNEVNLAPTAINLDNLNVAENSAGAIVGNLSTSDPDAGDSHSYTVDDGRFEVIAGQLKLIAGQSLDHETEATVDVTVTSTDAGGLSTNQLFTLTVNDLNDAPITINDNLAATEDTVLNFGSFATLIANDTDVEGDALSLSSFTQPGNGLLVDNADGTLSYTPGNNFYGTDSFNYRVSDGNGGFADGLALIVVTPVGDTPQVGNGSVISGSISTPIAVNCNPADGTEVSHFKISAISGGTLYLANGVTQINDGDYITLGQGQAGVLFAASDETATNGSFNVESSEDGSTVAVQSGVATSTVTIFPAAAVVIPELPETPIIEPELETTVDEEVLAEETEAVEEVVEEVLAPSEQPVPTQNETKETTTVSNQAQHFFSPKISNNFFRDSSARDSRQATEPESSAAKLLKVLLETTDLGSLQATWNSLDIDNLSSAGYEQVRSTLDAIQEELGQEVLIEKAMVGSAIATSVGLSAGYVVWMLKGGSLLASVLSSMPAWHLADPLSILVGRSDDEEDEESLETIIENSKPMDKVLDDGPEFKKDAD